MGRTLQELVNMVPLETENRVREVKRTFTRNIHNIIRQETGLRLSFQTNEELSSSRKGTAIPVHILPGVPEELENLEFPDDQTFSLLLAPWHHHLENVAKSGELILKDLIPELGEALLKGRDKFYQPATELAQELLDIIDKSQLIEILYSQEQTYLTDFLGVYRYNLNRQHVLDPDDERVNASIVLYWGVIGLCAADLNVTVEGLALKVLAHEWGHAYSHIGADIDGKRWPSQDFAQSEKSIKEGLAQYCALKVVKGLQGRFPDGYQAYEAILPRQPDIYRTHLGWIKYSPEEIRHAMLTTRRAGVAQLNDFNSSLVEAKERLRKGNSW